MTYVVAYVKPMIKQMKEMRRKCWTNVGTNVIKQYDLIFENKILEICSAISQIEFKK